MKTNTWGAMRSTVMIFLVLVFAALAASAATTAGTTNATQPNPFVYAAVDIPQIGVVGVQNQAKSQQTETVAASYNSGGQNTIDKAKGEITTPTAALTGNETKSAYASGSGTNTNTFHTATGMGTPHAPAATLSSTPALDDHHEP